MPDKHNKSILIVEDEQDLRRVLIDRCAHEGFVTLEARNGEEGLNLALQKHPDLILLDLEMPKMDGIEMLKQLRQDAWGKSIPVVVLTNYAVSDKIADVLEAGAYDYVIKSGQLKDIMAKVKQKLEPN